MPDTRTDDGKRYLVAVDEADHVLYFENSEAYCRFCGEVVTLYREVTMDDVRKLRKQEFYVTAADAWLQLNRDAVR